MKCKEARNKALFYLVWINLILFILIALGFFNSTLKSADTLIVVLAMLFMSFLTNLIAYFSMYCMFKNEFESILALNQNLSKEYTEIKCIKIHPDNKSLNTGNKKIYAILDTDNKVSVFYSNNKNKDNHMYYIHTLTKKEFIRYYKIK